MDANHVREWEKSVESAEINPLTANLPITAAPGQVFREESSDGIWREWLRVEVVAGNAGARWAYWSAWKEKTDRLGIGPNPESKVIADAIFNGDASHFCGMLATPFPGKIAGGPNLAWVMTSPRITPPRPGLVYLEETKERYEKSREVYDVQTHTSTKLP